MADVVDFRTTAFRVTSVSDSGRRVGSAIYWKLYTIENLLRVIINSILTEYYVTPEWWPLAAGVILLANNKDTLNDVVNQRRQQYKSGHKNGHVKTSPGKHNIYYVTLPKLGLIIAENDSLFRSKIVNIDELQKRIRRVKLPRNIVCHMNWLDDPDSGEIDNLYLELVQVVRSIQSDVPIIAPR